jgi:hypothetical protein
VWADNAAGCSPIIEILLGECVSVAGGAGNGSEEQTGMGTAHLDGALYPSTAFVLIVQIHARVVAMPQTAPHFTQRTGFSFVTFH